MEPYVQLLGVPSVRAGDRHYEPAPSRNSALAYYLAFHAHEWIARDEICGLFWPESRDERARNSLRQALYAVRGEPWSQGLQAERDRIRWSVATDLGLSGANGALPATLLEGFRIQSAPSFDQWLDVTRETVDADRRRVAHQAARDALDAGDGRSAADLLEPWLRLDPLDEATLRIALEAKVSQGLHAEANALYDRFAARLQQELGLAPSPATSAWIAVGRPSSPARPNVVAGPGERGAAEGRALFVGRESELESLATELALAGGIYVLVGPAGIGKTTLAREVVHRNGMSSGFATHVVELENVRASATAAAAVANELAPAGTPDVAPVDRIAAQFGARTAWVVLDNVEQIPDIEAFLRDVRERCPFVRWLATSRRHLQIDAVASWMLRGLESDTAPTPDAASEAHPVAPAVMLFEALCRRNGVEVHTERDRPAISAFCRSVGGAPLAIELAAGWTRVLPLEVTLQRWSDELIGLPVPGEERAQRHATLRGAVAESCSLLAPAERASLARLGVFAGGCTIEAADTVADVGLARLATLRDASLIAISASGRVTHHPAVAQSLRGLREELGGVSDEVIDRHARYYLAQLQRWEDLGQDNDPLMAVQSIQGEHANVERAWYRAIDRGMWRSLRGGGAFFGLSYALAGDGHSWHTHLGRAIAAMPEGDATRIYLRAHLGSTERFEGKRHRAYRLCRDAAVDGASVPDPKTRGWIAFHHGQTARFVDRVDEARSAFELAVRSWSRAGESSLVTMAIDELMLLARDRAEHERWYARSERLRRRGDPTLPAGKSKTADTSMERARVLTTEDGAYSEAVELVDSTLEMERSLRWNVFNLAIALTAASAIRREAGDLSGAVRDAREAVILTDDIHVPSYVDPEAARISLARAQGLAGDTASAAETLRLLPSTPSLEALVAWVEIALHRGDASAATPWIEELEQYDNEGKELRRDRWRRIETDLLMADWAGRGTDDGEARHMVRDALTRAWADRFLPSTLHAVALALRWLSPKRADSVAQFLLLDSRLRASTRCHPALDPWRGARVRRAETPASLAIVVEEVRAALESSS